MNKQMCSICNKDFNVIETHINNNGTKMMTRCSNCGAEVNAECEVELNDEQLARNDEIYNAIYNMCKVLTENENLEWNMNYIGDIAEFAANTMLRYVTDKIRFPAVVSYDNYGSQSIEEYYTCDEEE